MLEQNDKKEKSFQPTGFEPVTPGLQHSTVPCSSNWAMVGYIGEQF